MFVPAATLIVRISQRLAEKSTVPLSQGNNTVATSPGVQMSTSTLNWKKSVVEKTCCAADQTLILRGLPSARRGAEKLRTFANKRLICHSPEIQSLTFSAIDNRIASFVQSLGSPQHFSGSLRGEFYRYRRIERAGEYKLMTYKLMT